MKPTKKRNQKTRWSLPSRSSEFAFFFFSLSFSPSLLYLGCGGEHGRVLLFSALLFILQRGTAGASEKGSERGPRASKSVVEPQMLSARGSLELCLRLLHAAAVGVEEGLPALQQKQGRRWWSGHGEFVEQRKCSSLEVSRRFFFSLVCEREFFSLHFFSFFSLPSLPLPLFFLPALSPFSLFPRGPMRRPLQRGLSVAARSVALLLLLLLVAFAAAFAAAAETTTSRGGDDDGAPTTATVPSQHEQPQQHSHSPWRVSPLPQSGLEKGVKTARERVKREKKRGEGALFLLVFLGVIKLKNERKTKKPRLSLNNKNNRNRLLPSRRLPRRRGHGRTGHRGRLLRRGTEGGASCCSSRSRRRRRRGRKKCRQRLLLYLLLSSSPTVAAAGELRPPRPRLARQARAGPARVPGRGAGGEAAGVRERHCRSRRRERSLLSRQRRRGPLLFEQRRRGSLRPLARRQALRDVQRILRARRDVSLKFLDPFSFEIFCFVYFCDALDLRSFLLSSFFFLALLSPSTSKSSLSLPLS